MSEMRLGAAIRLEGIRPVGRLKVTTSTLPNSLLLPEASVAYFDKKDAEVRYNPSNEEFPFVTTLRSTVSPDLEPESRQSTTREALTFLMALSKPVSGENRFETLFMSEVAHKGAKALAETTSWFIERSTASIKERYADELAVLTRTGLLD